MCKKTQVCGCIEGERMCDVAEALWRHANNLYDKIRAGLTSWEIYEEARREYDRHFEDEPEPPGMNGTRRP